VTEVSGETAGTPGLETLWDEIGKLGASCLTGIAFHDVPPEGLALNPGKLADFPYVEGKALNFTPQKRRVAKQKPAAAKA